jgi:hypothetical protein
MAAMQISNVFGSSESFVHADVWSRVSAQQTGSVASISPFDIIIFKYQKGRYMGVSG